MAYSELAKEHRRCTGTRTDGEPCGAWACWDDPLQRCTTHAGRRPVGPGSRGAYGSGRARPRRSRRPSCHCAAYAWPHRPGSGVCRWPDPPLDQHPTPAGQHAAFRLVDRRKWYGHGYFW